MYVQYRLKQVQEKLIGKEKAASNLLDDAIAFAPERLYTEQENLFDLSRKANIALYVYNASGLVLWTNNSIFPARTDFSRSSFVQKLENGIYVQKNIRSHGFTFITLIPVKYEYAYENKYVRNHLALCSSDDIEFTVTDSGAGAFPIHSAYGGYLFGLQPHLLQQSFGFTGWLFVLGLFLLVWLVVSQVEDWISDGHNIRAIILSSILILTVIAFWKVFQLPRSVFSWALFSPSYFAASYIFSSMGDLLIFTLLLIYVVWLSLIMRSRKEPSYGVRLGVYSFYLFVLLLFVALIQNLIQSLVLDSQISFDLSNIFSLNIFSFAGLFIILSWIFIFYFLCQRLIQKILAITAHRNMFWAVLGMAAIAAAGAGLSLHFFHWMALIFGLGTALTAYFYFIVWRRVSPYVLPVIFVLLCAVFLTVRFSRDNFINRQQNMQLIANKLATERDAIVEYLFGNVLSGIQTDNFVHSYFETPLSDDQVLEKRLKQLFFSGYFSKYDVTIFSFTPEGIPFKSNQTQSLSYFLDILKKEGTPVRGSNLYYMHTYNGLPVYAAIIPVNESGIREGYLLIQLQEKAFYEESVYPELLLSENIERLKEMGNYSFAVYNKNVLVNQRGDYPYGGILQFNLPIDASGNAYFSEKGSDHVAHVSEDNVVIVSAPKRGALYYSSVFSLLLIISGGCLALVLALPAVRNWSRKVRLYRPQPISWRKLSFRNKILITILSGMTSTMFLVGVATVYYIYSQYNKDVLENLRKKTRSITTELDGFTQQADVNTASAEDFSSFVKELSRTYQSDINVFDIHGLLLTTTQELIYENNVLAPRMDPAAYLRFYVGNTSQLIQDEKIGTLKYISSYMPLRNKDGIVTGFVNLPYFSKAEELNDRISSFVVALINLYLLLLLILMVIGLVMARRLTAPFEILRNHLLNVDLDKPNEIIEWQSGDEIGKLIQAYNSLVGSLQESAHRLADAERERGWKDIAQNIAHDIKNPLMPMKLHIQRLQNAQTEGTGSLNDMFPKVSDLIIRQIDLLAETANEINDFAKLSKGNPERIDLKKAIGDVVHLFSLQDETAIHCFLPKEELCIFIDPSQLSRVFNNLVKNALQAIPAGKKGIVQIAAYKDQSGVVVKVEDNGQGISEENKKNIFTPRFSTKTSGTGLGLAIVRRIIELAGGTISFVSTEGVGTTFIIRLPECEKEQAS